MKTVTIQIGNSDDKLTQAQWALFVHQADNAIRQRCNRVHFFSTSPNTEAWQNAAWVIEIYENAGYALRSALKELRELFNQDSVAWTEGETSFV